MLFRSGRIVLEFGSVDDLERIVALIDADAGEKTANRTEETD